MYSLTVPNPIRVKADNNSGLTGGPLFISSQMDTFITLTCSVTLSQFVDIAVNVQYNWTGPHMFSDIQYASSVVQSLDTNMISIGPLTLSRAGMYMCLATITSNQTSAFINGTGIGSSTTNVALCKCYMGYIRGTFVLHILSHCRPD